MNNRITVLIIIFLLIPALSIAGTAYYVDSKAPNGGNGSYAKPWNSIQQVNSYSFSEGDDLYFRAGATITMTTSLGIYWGGSANDRVIIGSYYGRDQFGLFGSSRPILDGKNSVPNYDYDGLINYKGSGYVTIQDLELRNSYSKGINLTPKNFSKYNVIKNCRIKNSGRQAISLARTSHGLIENCYIERTSQRKIKVPGSTNPVHAGAGIEITGMSDETSAQYNVVRGCTITKSFESVGVYKGAKNTTIENNTIYDFAQVGVYVANARYAVIRNNLIYESANSWLPGNGRDALIWIDSEGNVSNIIKVTGHIEIYNNYLAGGDAGIRLVCSSNHLGVYQSNNKIYGNRFVDCNDNFQFRKTDPNWRNNRIYGNYSFIFTDGLNHYNRSSPPGVTWENNYFNSGVSGDAAFNAKINKVSLVKEAGWRSLGIGNVTTSFFKLKSEPLSDAAIIPKAPNLRIESSTH